ncbi:RecQ family ATP-dependent DNA helicase [Niallia sp. 01092]|uniref:RecQ family ATP-dependent DNA helicase n=1 Tax=unclassified Niallia TaxID=2837522 RepID=UPI003FD07B39
MNLEKSLQQLFHFDAFRPGQEEVIASILESNHTLAMLPTGTGKSLCYQFPGMLLEGIVIIISPLLSLMQDQVEQMKMNGEKRVVALNSFLSKSEKNDVLQNIRKYKFLFISPEMISNDHVLAVFKSLKISLFVIDEAHCISQWGYDFRPEYQKIGFVRKELNNPVTLALTATATEEIRNDIKESLFLQEVKEVVYSVNRPNIALSVEKLFSLKEKMNRLVHLVQTLQGPGIIYFSSKKIAEQTAAYLREKSKVNCTSYHGGMTQEDRILIQQQFLHGQLDIICATSAFGMGINKENIRFVIHFHMPSQFESYLQEIGRAGRDQLQSISILLYTPGDEFIAYQLAEMEWPSELQIKQLEMSLLQYNKYDDWEKSEKNWLEHHFSEVQWRVLEAYIQSEKHDMSLLLKKLHAYKRHRTIRLENKKQKIAGFLNWIHAEHCRRILITTYFAEENKPSFSQKCCDKCGLDMSDYDKSRTINLNHSHIENWKELLARILLKSEWSNE